jgi:NADH-quinone oxidoreductase subunit J
VTTGDLIWYLFAAVTVGAGLVVAFSRSVVHSGMALLFSLLGVSAMYVFLGADFLAITQIVVYVGGILVLVLFAVMMTNRIMSTSLTDELVQPAPALAVAIVVLALMLLTIYRTVWPLAALSESQPTTALIGHGIMTRYLFPFEFTSILLLVAMMGAAMIIRERGTDREDSK